jgi:predicted glycosyltransferase
MRQNKPGWFSNSRVVIPNGPVDGLNVIFHSDLVVSGGGTMNREAAALGVPAYSILACEVGAVDRALEKSGQLTFVTSPKDFVQKIKLVRRPRPLAVPNQAMGALESIMAHLEEILALEYAEKPLRKAVPAARVSAIS